MIFIINNHGLTFFTNVDFYFSGKKALFSIQNIAKTIFFHFICQKNTDRFLDKNHGREPLWQISIFWHFFKGQFSGLKSIHFYPEFQKAILRLDFLTKKHTNERTQNLNKNHGLTLSKISIFFFLFKFYFSGVKKHYLLIIYQKTSFSYLICSKTQMG